MDKRVWPERSGGQTPEYAIPFSLMPALKDFPALFKSPIPFLSLVSLYPVKRDAAAIFWIS